ncbi:LysR family transcriptional regulator [Pigmentiphaga aceris]|uniref:LysR family transcriptional regulator n=1 Tax=Pigmentiphaga aceris TaxID=1940612 RepID=A0A5C0AUD1_9BURK|nr:LysR family transcriptional regulator [Pigmentiphaga aceris]QEI05745.1 LysR family transcriptional regulator [Pigmentiphaga aceris]
MLPANLSQLSAFSAVARLGSFGKAGAELSLSTSAISHAIRTLEERLGLSLFNRTTRSVALTEAGQHLLERIEPALRDVGKAIEEMNDFRARPAGTLRINTSRGAGQLVLMPIVPRFLALYPDISVELVDNEGMVDIVAEGFDAGVRFLNAVPEDMVGVPIGIPQRFVVVGTPAYFARHAAPLQPDDLLSHECVRYRFPSGRMYKWDFEKDGVRREVDVPGRVTLGDSTMEVQAALAGVGLAITLESVVRQDIDAGRLIPVLEDWSMSVSSFTLYYPRQRRLKPALRAFVDLLREARGEPGLA